MSFTIEERITSRNVRSTLTNRTIEQTFLVTADPGDTVDEVDVDTFLREGGVPSFFNGGTIPLDTIETNKRVNEEVYEALVTYKTEDTDTEEEEGEQGRTDNFDTTGGSIHISHGLEKISDSGTFTPLDLTQINYDGERIQGLDIPAAAYKFSQVFTKKDSEVTDTFINKIFELTNTVNNAAVKGFPLRCLLFRGVIGSRIVKNEKDINGNPVEDVWSLTYTFEARRVENDIKIGSFVIATKQGWDYLTTDFQDHSDSSIGRIVRIPVGVRVLRVFPESNFAELGINI